MEYAARKHGRRLLLFNTLFIFPLVEGGVILRGGIPFFVSWCFFGVFENEKTAETTYIYVISTVLTCAEDAPLKVLINKG